MTTQYQLHRNRWNDCDRCPLHLVRSRVVLARGSLPCDVLFIGEAPGDSEDTLGKPFCGPAGELLDLIIDRAIGTDYKVAFTNILACIPKDPETGDKVDFKELEDYLKKTEAITKCEPRLNELVNIADPKVVILVGTLARKAISGQAQFGERYRNSGWFLEFADILHPAAILRMDVAQRGLAIQRCVVTIADAMANAVQHGLFS